jgi:putative chitinase
VTVTTKPLITAAQLQRFAPKSDYMGLAPQLDRAARDWAIDTDREIRHWLAHLHHESLGFTRLVENLNYSAERLTKVWPRRFPTLAAAAPYARNPRKLANKVYGGRMGNTGPDDGWIHRGRGLLMHTGKEATEWAARHIGPGVLKDPMLVARVDNACRLAAAWWTEKGLNRVVAADPGETVMQTIAAHVRENEDDDLLSATEKINGGRNGLADRMTQLLRAAQIWPGR